MHDKRIRAPPCRWWENERIVRDENQFAVVRNSPSNQNSSQSDNENLSENSQFASISMGIIDSDLALSVSRRKPPELKNNFIGTWLKFNEFYHLFGVLCIWTMDGCFLVTVNATHQIILHKEMYVVAKTPCDIVVCNLLAKDGIIMQSFLSATIE